MEPELLENHRFFLLVLARKYIDRRLRSKSSQADLVQQTLLLAYKNLPSYRGSTDVELRAWLAAILRRQCINERKRYFGTSKRKANSERPGLTETLISRDPSVSETAILKETTEMLFRAIDRLDVQQGQVVRLRLIQFLSVEEIADRLQISRHAVLRRWKASLLRLKEMLGDND